MRTRSTILLVTLAAAVLLLVRTAAQDQGQAREFTVVGDGYAYAPGTITVNRNDLVKITFRAQDMPHTFSIDGPYRISKRAAAGQSVTFEFRADQPGNHAIYCALSTDPKCKDMKGTLTVR